jgi:hypothetical protein
VKRKILFLIILSLFVSSVVLAKDEKGEKEEYKLDLSEIEKKPYHVGGFGEFRPVLSGLDKSAAFYKINFYNRNEGRTLSDYNFRLQLDGSYEEGIARFFTRLNYDLVNTYQGWSNDTTIYEGYLSLKPSNSVALEVGKKTMKWGKGYAWNPVAFLDRPKDPNDPELALEGFWVASADFIKSYSGPLKTLSFTPVLLPVIYNDINTDFGGKNQVFGTFGNSASPVSPGNQINGAGKLYLLLYDTDIDFIVFTGGSKTTRYGVDFSRNISTNLEIHGEFAHFEDFQQIYIDRSGNIHSSTYDTQSYLLGLRYLTERDTTYIMEYYHNGTGFTKGQEQDFYSFVDQSYNTYLATGQDSFLAKAQKLAQSGYGNPNNMRDYFYLRVSQKEPFDILYFTPAFTAIWNLKDYSISLAPELLYTGITNWEFRLKGTIPMGNGYTEFAEKTYNYRIDFRARYFF